MNNLLSYYGLDDARISASEKDLPVLTNLSTLVNISEKTFLGEKNLKNYLGQQSNTKVVSQYSSEVVYTIVSASPCSPIIMFA